MCSSMIEMRRSLGLRRRFRGSLRCKLRGSFGVNADEFTSSTLVLEFNKALDHRKQRVVLAAADVVAGLPLCAALAGEDIAAEHVLAAEFLKSEPLCIRIAAVA